MSDDSANDEGRAGTYFLGRYRVVAELGSGGMGSVHLARLDAPGGFQRFVAIKRIHAHLSQDNSFVDRFLDEARIGAGIHHPNVAPTLEVGCTDGRYWMVMEYLHGEPLSRIMVEIGRKNVPPLGYEQAALLIAHAAEGLHAAHELRGPDGALLNLVHRDVSPHNLFVTFDGEVKVVDFGVAKADMRLSSDRAGVLVGKFAYMSPEQTRGIVDRRTDVFALGVVLWELTVQRPLFGHAALSPPEILERISSGIVPPPSSIVASYPAELEQVVLRALARDPERRFATARELSRALQSFLMRCGTFPDLGAYMHEAFADVCARKLAWVAEVTQTVNIDELLASHGDDENPDD